jgi:hypothetical protein
MVNNHRASLIPCSMGLELADQLVHDQIGSHVWVSTRSGASWTYMEPLDRITGYWWVSFAD